MEKPESKDKKVTWDAFLIMTTGGAIMTRTWTLDEIICYKIMGRLDSKSEKSRTMYSYYIKVELTGSAEAHETMRGGEWPDGVEVTQILSGSARAYDQLACVRIAASMSHKSRSKIVEMWMAEQKALDEEERQDSEATC